MRYDADPFGVENAEPLGGLGSTMLLRTDPMRGVHIDPKRCLAVVEAGGKWEDVVPAASELELAALHGSTPDVSVAGYSLGGGVDCHGGSRLRPWPTGMWDT